MVVLEGGERADLTYYGLDVELPMIPLCRTYLRVGSGGREIDEELAERGGGNGDVVTADALQVMRRRKSYTHIVANHGKEGLVGAELLLRLVHPVVQLLLFDNVGVIHGGNNVFIVLLEKSTLLLDLLR